MKDPVRNINTEFLHGLEVMSNKEMPLPGARIKGGPRDPRFTHLESGTGEMVAFTHLATVRHRPTDQIFIAFRKTMDALYFEQSDPAKYPNWLMDNNVKKTELTTYIHVVRPPFNQSPTLVMRDPNIMDVTAQTRTSKWLAEISLPWVFDTVAYFLLKNNVITQEMYGKID